MKYSTPLTRRLLRLLLVPAVLGGLILYAASRHYPIIHSTTADAVYGDISIARPLFTHRARVVVFADTRHFPANTLAQRIATAGAAVMIVDSHRALQAVTDTAHRCLAPDRLGEGTSRLARWLQGGNTQRTLVAGIGPGGLLPLLFAETKSAVGTECLSVGFSVELPDAVPLCSPWTETTADGKRMLTSGPPLRGAWTAVWTDQPGDPTALFVRGLAGAQTAIAPYDTPLDVVAVDELKKRITHEETSQIGGLPVVEVPAKSPNDTVTLFYSGDGGWRDLDREVAGEMAARGFPVVGVDTLRAFWSSKSPEETAKDLSRLMAYYRTAWKAKKFVLAGYSFGADILPAVYNRLPASDRDTVALLLLVALGKTADFEIHVSGWIGKSNDGLPLLPELNHIAGDKILCIFGKEERNDSACPQLTTQKAEVLELPGGHHFDKDYPKLAQRIIATYQRIGIKGSN